MMRVPENAGCNVNAKANVTALPETVTTEVAPVMRHWLFCREEDVPSVIGPSHALFASLRNDRAARAGSSDTQHALVPLIAVFITTSAAAISAPPFGSEYVK